MDKENQATPAIDYDKLGAAVAPVLAQSLSAALGEANKPVLEALGKLQPTQVDTASSNAAGKPGEGTSGAGAGLTLEQVGQLFDQKLQSFQTSQQATAARQTFIDTKLKDLPPAYRTQLGNDPNKWAAEEQTIRQQYQADFKAAGGKPAVVDGAQNTDNTTAPVQTVDTSKLSGFQLIDLAVKTGPKPQPAGTAPAAPAAAGAK